jgi:carboxyl-terminal processing protease
MNLKSSKQGIYILTFIILSFFCGYLVGQKQIIENVISNYNNQKQTNILQDFNNSFKTDKNIDLKLFNEAYSTIANNYYSFNNISEKDIVYWMIKWLTDSLKDKHTEFFNIDETKKFNETLSWDFEWIWAVIEKSDFWIYIDRLIAGSPAKEAGLLSGDIIIKANDIDFKNMSVNDAVAKIRWPAWSKIKLEIIRVWEKQTIIKEVTRRKINIPSVDSKILDNNVWYIVLSIFWEKSWDEFKKSLDDMQSKNIKWLIIDLRDDWGGYLETAVSILSNFIEKDKTLVTTKEKNPTDNRSYFSYWNDYKKIPLVVLINWNSASASEITAWALKDYNLAVLVWENSYWKWSVQEPFVLSDWSEIKITVAKWYTPLDHWIDWVGIKPDVESKFKKEDFDNKFDRQLDDAKKVIAKIIELKDIKATKDYYNVQKQNELKDKLNSITSSGNTNTWSNNN